MWSCRDQPAFDALHEGITGRRHGSAGRGLRQVLERAPAEQAPEAVEAVVPVVVAGDAEQHAGSGVRRAFLQDRVPWPEQPALELVSGGQRIGGIAPEHEDISSRQPPGFFASERVLGENHARHSPAQVVVVPGVGDEVDPHGTVAALRQGVPRLRRAEHPAHSIEEARPTLGLHPVAQVELLAGRGHRHQMSQVAHECGRPEPADRQRRMSSAVEPSDSRRRAPGRKRRRLIGTPSLSRRLRGAADRVLLHRREDSLLCGNHRRRDEGRGPAIAVPEIAEPDIDWEAPWHPGARKQLDTILDQLTARLERSRRTSGSMVAHGRGAALPRRRGGHRRDPACRPQFS